MKNKEASIQKEFERKSKELQDYLQRNDEKARKGLLSQNEIAQIEQKAQAMQQELVQYEQTKAKEISEQSVEKITSIRKKIEALGKDYCTKNGIQILLIHGDGGQLNFIDNSMNVTSDFIRYLNENQSEIEKDLK
jgi:outer membrane protein